MPLAVLRGHTGLVKGVSWHPSGHYIATQAADKTLRIWRTSDWREDACLREPFADCAGRFSFSFLFRFSNRTASTSEANDGTRALAEFC